MLDGKSVTIPPVSEKGQDARMTRRRVLILAAIVAALLLAADFHDLFALPSFRRLWPWLGELCRWLAKPIPMALVTLGACLAGAPEGQRTAACGGQSGGGAAAGYGAGAATRSAWLCSPDSKHGPSHVHRVFLWLSPLGGMSVLRPRRAARGAYGAACRGRSVGGGTGASRWTALSFGGAGHGGDNGGLPVAFDGPCTTPCCESRSLTRKKRAPSERSLPFERRFP